MTDPDDFATLTNLVGRLADNQEDFVDAVLADPTMTDSQKINHLHAAAKDRANRLEVAREMAVQGLFVEGGHHKQWILEQIIVRLDRSDTTIAALINAGRQWTRGVQP